jgi:hypothetical protein
MYHDSEGSNDAIEYISTSTTVGSILLSGVVSMFPQQSLSITNVTNDISKSKRVCLACMANDKSTIVIQIYGHEVQFRNATIYAICMNPHSGAGFKLFRRALWRRRACALRLRPSTLRVRW